MIRCGVLVDFKNLSPLKAGILNQWTAAIVVSPLDRQDPLFWWVLLNAVWPLTSKKALQNAPQLVLCPTWLLSLGLGDVTLYFPYACGSADAHWERQFAKGHCSLVELQTLSEKSV